MAVDKVQQKYRDKNRDKFNELRRKYRKNNPEIYRASEKRARSKRLSIIWELKDKPCKDCNIQYPPYVMQFDHILDNKIDCVSKLNSIQAIIEEAAKCEVVCANCHSIRTWKRKNGS